MILFYGNQVLFLLQILPILQNLNSLVPILVTLNDDGQINPKKIIKNINYSHPLFTLNSVKAQKKHNIISGKNRTPFAGAYWGNGFHEDGIKSAHDVFSQINKFLK